jgi:hypothetical protein
MNTSSSSATPSTNMETCPRKFSAAPASLALTGTKPSAVTALFMAAQKHFPSSDPSDTDDDDDTDYDAAAAYESDDST